MYSNVSFLVKYKIMIIIIVLKHRYSFSSQNSIFVYPIPYLIQKNPYYSFSLWVLGLANIIKAFLIVLMIFLPMTAVYINTLSTCNI